MYKFSNRDEVPKEFKWDLTDFFKNEEEVEESYKVASEEVDKLINYKDFIKEPEKIYEFLNDFYRVLDLVENLYVYAYLKNDECLLVKENVIRKNKMNDLFNKFNVNTNFFDSELLKFSNSQYEDLFVKCPCLNEFKSTLDKIYRDHDHILSSREESIISEIVNSMDNFSDISSNLLNQEHNYGKIKVDGETEIISTNNYSRLMQNNDRNLRKKVYLSFNKKLDEYASTSVNLLYSYVKGNNTVSKLHNFKSSWDRKLFKLNLSDKVFSSLTNVVLNSGKSLQRYYKLKKDVLGLNKLYPYDLGVDLINLDKKYTIDEAISLIKESLKPLGEEYSSKLNKIFDNHYIDFCGYKGKCSGGYSFATLSHDSRILMSYNANLDSVSTIIHESGHNVHHQFLKENNPLQYREQTTIVSEVASLTNECLLSDYIVKNASSKEEKLAGLQNIIRVISSNLFGAVREGKLEQDFYDYVNNGEVLTKEFMGDLTKKSLKNYYGKEVVMDKYVNNSWITRSHYFMNFYLYSYAISISVALYVSKEVINGNKEMLDNYIKFLSTGCDKWTIETFKVLQINLEEEDIYKRAVSYFDELVCSFEKIYYDKEVDNNE